MKITLQANSIDSLLTLYCLFCSYSELFQEDLICCIVNNEYVLSVTDNFRSEFNCCVTAFTASKTLWIKEIKWLLSGFKHVFWQTDTLPQRNAFYGCSSGFSLRAITLLINGRAVRLLSVREAVCDRPSRWNGKYFLCGKWGKKGDYREPSTAEQHRHSLSADLTLFLFLYWPPPSAERPFTQRIYLWRSNE